MIDELCTKSEEARKSLCDALEKKTESEVQPELKRSRGRPRQGAQATAAAQASPKNIYELVARVCALVRSVEHMAFIPKTDQDIRWRIVCQLL